MLLTFYKVGQTALFSTVTSSVELTQVLLSYDANPNVCDTLTGRTPLMECAGYASNEDMARIVHLLIGAGAYLDPVDARKMTAADYARDKKDRLDEFLHAVETAPKSSTKEAPRSRLNF